MAVGMIFDPQQAEDIVAALDLGHAPDAPISDADDIAGLPA